MKRVIAMMVAVGLVGLALPVFATQNELPHQPTNCAFDKDTQFKYDIDESKWEPGYPGKGIDLTFTYSDEGEVIGVDTGSSMWVIVCAKVPQPDKGAGISHIVIECIKDRDTTTTTEQESSTTTTEQETTTTTEQESTTTTVTETTSTSTTVPSTSSTSSSTPSTTEPPTSSVPPVEPPNPPPVELPFTGQSDIFGIGADLVKRIAGVLGLVGIATVGLARRLHGEVH